MQSMRDLTTQEYIQETIQLAKNIKENLIFLGGRLLKIYNQDLWRGYAGSWKEFLAEMDLSKSTATKLMKIWQNWVIEKGMEPEKIADKGISKLYMAIPLLEEEKPEEVIEKVETLSKDDLNQVVTEKTKPEHIHTWHRIEKCYKCGAQRTLEVYDEKEEKERI